MAETEKVKILGIEINDTAAVKSIAELRANIKALKDEINKADENTPFEEVQKATQQLREQQNALRNAMYAQGTTWKEVTAAAKGTGQSYNALVAQMANLKTHLRTIDTSTEEGVAEFKKYATQINDINTRLKQMDALQGNFQRNVGMYTQKIAGMGNAFKAVAGAAGSVINPIAGATAGLQAMSATPVIGILGLLANVIGKVISSMQKSEGMTNRLTEAFAGFSAIGDLVTKGLQALGNAVAWVVEKMGNLITAIAGANEQQQKRIEITKQELELAKQQRETTMANAEAERDIAELRAKSSDKERYTASERLEFSKQAAELENEMAKRAYESLKNEYEIIKAKNALAESTTEELKQEADAYAAMVKAETEYYTRIRTNNREQSRLRKEEAKDAKDAAKEAQEALKARINAEKELLSQELELAEKGSEESLSLQLQIRAKELELAKNDARTKIQDRDALNKTLSLLEQKYGRDILSLERANQRAREEQENLHLQNVADSYEKGSLEYLGAIRDLRAQELAQIQREETESEEEYVARRLKAEQALSVALSDIRGKRADDALTALERETSLKLEYNEVYEEDDRKRAARAYEITAESNQRRLNLLAQFAQEALSAGDMTEYLNYSQEVADLEVEMELNAAKEKKRIREQDKKDAEEKIKSAISLMQGYAGATSSILGSLADMYENDSKEGKKYAKRIKSLRIASATIDMLSGAVAAFATAQRDPGGLAGMILGAANAAAVIATGTANIAKIRKTDATGGNTSATTAPAPAPVLSVPQVRTITTAEDMTRLNQSLDDVQVYILSSDLEAERRNRRVKVKESSF